MSAAAQPVHRHRVHAGGLAAPPAPQGPQAPAPGTAGQACAADLRGRGLPPQSHAARRASRPEVAEHRAGPRLQREDLRLRADADHGEDAHLAQGGRQRRLPEVHGAGVLRLQGQDHGEGGRLGHGLHPRRGLRWASSLRRLHEHPADRREGSHRQAAALHTPPLAQGRPAHRRGLLQLRHQAAGVCAGRVRTPAALAPSAHGQRLSADPRRLPRSSVRPPMRADCRWKAWPAVSQKRSRN
mmetsp:Transcript_92740/g.276601  ORF Transcript_92740/g.276601 Transcript_92740/m.276601 type:complete len:241 (+) Transcript_92740:331-1053(+)